MTEPLRLFNGHLRIDATAPDGVASEIGLADALAQATRLATMPTVDLFDARAGHSFAFGAGGASSFGAESVYRALDLGREVSAARTLGDRLDAMATATVDPLIGRPLALAVAPSFALSATVRLPGDERFSETASVRMSAAAAARVDGSEGALRSLSGWIAQARSLEVAANEASEAIYADIAYFRSSRDIAELRAALASRDPNRIVAAAAPVLLHLAQTERNIASVGRVLADGGELIDGLAGARITLGAAAAVRGAFEIDRTIRMRVAEVSTDTATARLTIAATLGAISPLQAPEGTLPPIPGMAAVRSLMVSATAIATASIEGLAELRGLIGDAARLAEDAGALTHEARTTPRRYEDRGEAERAQQRIADIEARGSALAARAERVADELFVRTAAGLRVREATGIGFAIRAVGAQLDGSVGAFRYRLAVTLHNLVGTLPGVRTDYRAGEDESGAPALVARTPVAEDVFSTFYPFRLSVDAALGIDDEIRGHRASVELRGGIDSSAAAMAGYAAVRGRIDGFSLTGGVVFPDLRRTGTLAPQLTIGLGLESESASLTLSAGADASILSGDPRALHGLHAGLSGRLSF
ncbi:MAG: hypothetical protein IT381_11915 [Deltaproteobacteria bacterium]|nr:hypothetical protein [Deltaproteobacteria bacterium]